MDPRGLAAIDQIEQEKTEETERTSFCRESVIKVASPLSQLPSVQNNRNTKKIFEHNKHSPR